MRLFLKSIALFFILLIALNYPIAYLIGNHFYTFDKQSWILSKSGLQLDYAVLGSSRVYNMIDINSVDKEYEKKGINIATSGSNYAENFIILSEFISKNKISTLILNVDEFSFNSTNSFTYPFHDYELLPLFKKYDFVFKDFIPIWKYYLWKAIPIAKYCEFNNQFTLKMQPNKHLDESKGTGLKSHANFKLKKRQKQLTEIDIKYFMKIIQICSEKNIKTILVTTPIYKFDTKKTDFNITNFIRTILKSKNVTYYTPENLIDCNNIKYFNDAAHTDSAGSIEYSINLGKKLKSDNQ